MKDDQKNGSSSADILKLIKGAAAEGSLHNLQAMQADLEKTWPLEVFYAKNYARMIRARFLELRQQGFNDNQALQLTMKWMWP